MEEIYQYFLEAQQQNTLEDATEELIQLTPEPMNRMVPQQSKEEAITKRIQRRSMIVQDVPPTELRKINNGRVTELVVSFKMKQFLSLIEKQICPPIFISVI